MTVSDIQSVHDIHHHVHGSRSLIQHDDPGPSDWDIHPIHRYRASKEVLHLPGQLQSAQISAGVLCFPRIVYFSLFVTIIHSAIDWISSTSHLTLTGLDKAEVISGLHILCHLNGSSLFQDV